MKAAIIKIGNSRGIRIPKPVFEQCGFDQEVELKVQDHKLIIRPSGHPRSNWESAFKSMARADDDTSLKDLKAIDSDWDEADWEWK